MKSLQRRLKNKIKGSSNWLKLQKKIALLHLKVANRRKDWLYKLAHYLCSTTNNIFVEDINFTSWQLRLFGKQIGNSAIGKFINEILPFVAWKTRTYYQKVDKNFTSQQCPNCQLVTGKKSLSKRVHNCQYCGIVIDRDVAAEKAKGAEGAEGAEGEGEAEEAVKCNYMPIEKAREIYGTYNQILPGLVSMINKSITLTNDKMLISPSLPSLPRFPSLLLTHRFKLDRYLVALGQPVKSKYT